MTLSTSLTCASMLILNLMPAKRFKQAAKKGNQKKKKGKGCETLRNHLLGRSTGEPVSWLQVIAAWSGLKRARFNSL